MQTVSLGGSNPLSLLEEKLIEHKKAFSWVFIIMTIIIIILLAILLWPAANAKATEAFNTEFNQMNFSGLTNDNRTKEQAYDRFSENLVKQGFDPDPRNSTQRRFDSNFEGRAV